MADELVHELLDRVLASYRRIVATHDDPELALRGLVHEAFSAIATDRATGAVMVNEWSGRINPAARAFGVSGLTHPLHCLLRPGRRGRGLADEELVKARKRRSVAGSG